MSSNNITRGQCMWVVDEDSFIVFGPYHPGNNPFIHYINSVRNWSSSLVVYHKVIVGLCAAVVVCSSRTHSGWPSGMQSKAHCWYNMVLATTAVDINWTSTLVQPRVYFGCLGWWFVGVNVIENYLVVQVNHYVDKH